MALAALKEELDTWDAALQAFDASDHEKALSIFERISDTSKIVMNIGLIHMYQGDLEMAVEKFTSAIKLDHFLAIGYFQRGICHYNLKNMEQAAQDFCDAEIMMRGNNVVLYHELGLPFSLYADKVVLNRGLALVQAGREKEGLAFLHRVGAEDTSELSTMPTGLLFRPSPGKRKFLLEYQASGTVSFDQVSTTAGPKSDTSSTCAPSDTSSVISSKKPSNGLTRSHSNPDASTSASASSSTTRHMRSDLLKAMGIDLIVPTTEISTIPCAGVRIASGKLVGLMGWRFVVELDETVEPTSRWQKQKPRHWKNVARPAVVANFILDTGCANSPVSQEMLRALGYRGSYKAGAEVNLRIQGVRAKCVVAHMGEASRLGGQFMTSGSLTFYFDTKLNAPVLYVGDETNERPTNIPRTVSADLSDKKNRRLSLRDSVTSFMSSFNILKSPDP